MMVDVNMLSRYCDLLAAKHVAIANTYLIRDKHNHADAYSSTAFYNLLLNNKYILKPSEKRKFAGCNLIAAVVASPIATRLSSLSQSHLADEWADYTNSIPQSIVVAAPIDVVKQPQLPVLFFASCPESPKYVFTLQFSAKKQGLGTHLSITHINSLQSFLAVYLNHWVYFNSLTAAIAQSIA